MRPATKRESKPSVGMRLGGGEPLSFEKSKCGRSGVNLPETKVGAADLLAGIPAELRRDDEVLLPELSEVDVVRHFTRLSRLNASVEVHGYPLGSCTMKYNPRVHESLVRLPGFAHLHPETPEHLAQGALQLMYELGEALRIVTGLAGVTLVPAAGAHGELAGVMMMRKGLEKAGSKKDTILIPDSAHGTNPATCTVAGLRTKQISSGPEGILRADDVRQAMDDSIGGIMITNPNTLGLFETGIEEIAEIIHAAGGYVYMDGANLNALLGHARPGDFGVDALHINLHKTFSQPHGGGGPGAGPVAVSDRLKPFLPYPRIEKIKGADGQPYYRLDRDVVDTDSIGLMREFVGNFGVFVRSYAFILRLGGKGLQQVSEKAVLNANYVRARLEKDYELCLKQPHLHEAVFTDSKQQAHHVSTLDVAKRLIDYGFHPPTVYFPLHVKNALMIEPTESESKDSLDAFCDAMLEIAREVEETPEVFHDAPYSSPVGRLDETAAARKPVLNWQMMKS